MGNRITIESVNGIAPNWILVVNDTTGMQPGDHLVAALEGGSVGEGAPYRVDTVVDATTVNIIDNLKIGGGEYGKPSRGVAQFYSPTVNLGLSQQVVNGRHWAEPLNRDKQILDINAGGGGGSGWIKITDVDVPGGAASDKVYQDSPGNTVLQSATVSATAIELNVRASYPIIDIGGSQTILAESGDGGHYLGVVSHMISGTGPLAVSVLTADGVAGAVDTVDLTLDAPPELLTLSFTGAYPGSQTELKAGDTFQLTGTTDINADAVEIQDVGACIQSLETFVAGTTFTVTGTIADRGTTLQALPATVRARSATTGAFGTARTTDELGGTTDAVDLVNLNNLFPTVTITGINYPATQQALKGSETATVAVTTSDLDTITYTSPTSELQITNPTTDEPNKTVQRIAGGYNITTDNFRAEANRAANDATTIETAVVNIADTPASIDVVLPAARLVSGGNDGTTIQSHLITIQSDQELLSVDMDEDTGGGTFTGSWSGGPLNWTRTIQVHDDDAKGTYTWQNLVATNLAGIVTSSIATGATYDLGGFVARSLTFGPFLTTTNMDVEVVDFSKLQAGIFTSTNQPALKQSIGTSPPVVNGYTINNTGLKPTTVIWLDTAAASVNSTGTAQITDVEELA